MNIVLIGYGNVGKNIQAVLSENGFSVDVVIRSDGVYQNRKKVEELEDFMKYIDPNSVVFVSTPTFEKPDEMYHYYEKVLSAGARIITCEKSVLAHHPEFLQNSLVSYSATVGGDSGLLLAIKEFSERGKIHEIKAVVNGTLNYVSIRLKEEAKKEDIFVEVTEKGFAEPGMNNFDQVVDTELRDVLYKAVIVANVSGLYKKIIRQSDIKLVGYREGFRCVVSLNKELIQAGFVEEESAEWLPGGATAVLCINGEKVAEGPGAGGRITAERMVKDFLSLI